MTTPFEVFVADCEEAIARQAANAAFAEITRLEGLLSRYDHGSDVSRINRLHPGEFIRVSPDVFECIAVAAWATDKTAGAFDVTVGPCCDLRRRPADSPPTQSDLAEARGLVGMRRLQLDDSVFAVGLRPDTTGGVTMDLGGIGKGFALDRAADILDDWELNNYLLVAGGSTVLASGRGAEGQGWIVGVGARWGRAAGVDSVALHGQSLSGSGTEVKGAHIIDPATGLPANAHLAAWAVCPSATISDALSTAFLIMPTDRVRAFCTANPDVGAWVVEPDGQLTVLPPAASAR